MVKEIEKEGRKYYQCAICGIYYETREWAQKCEEFCRKNKSCSVEITKHAVEIGK